MNLDDTLEKELKETGLGINLLRGNGISLKLSFLSGIRFLLCPH